MFASKLVPQAVAMIALTLIAAGCGQSAPTDQQISTSEGQPAAASQDEPAIQDPDVQPATATSRIDLKDPSVAPAVATAPIDGAPSDAGDSQEPATRPDGPREPLPLEEATDSGQSMPQVHFTEEHAKWSLVHVGDQFPKLELADLTGKKRNFGELLGEKLTIVVFWQSSLPTSLEALADSQARYLGEFSEQGVAVVGVNVGDEPLLARELSGQAAAEYPQLSDRDHTAFAHVATQKLPRTYLLDASGKILWFDIEYSRSTRQQLLSAIRFSLKSE
jgi:peroxiredoxin